MNARMDKYDTDDNKTFSRSEKNKELYKSINSNEVSKFDSYNNVKIIDEGAKEIDLNKIRNYVESLNGNEYVKPRRSLVEDKNLPDIKTNEIEETKDYDINSILEKAREQREKDYEQDKYKKLRDTQFDILSKLKVNEENKPDNEEEFNTEEKTLINLINTVADNKFKNDLLAELQEENDELEEENEELKEELEKTKQTEMKNAIAEEVKEELQKQQLEDKKEQTEVVDNPNIKNTEDSFFTNSLSFSKEDFDDGEESGGSFFRGFIIFLIVLLIIAVVIGILYLVFDINVINIVKNFCLNLLK